MRTFLLFLWTAIASIDAWSLISPRQNCAASFVSPSISRNSRKDICLESPDRIAISSPRSKFSTRLFSSRVASTRRARASGVNRSSSPAVPTKVTDKNLIFLGRAGGAIENILEEYVNGDNLNYQYNNIIFLMNRLPFSTSLLDALPTVPLARQRISLLTFDPSSSAGISGSLQGWKIISNDVNSKEVLSRMSFLSSLSTSSSPVKGGDVVVSIDDLNEYERLKFLQQQKFLADKGQDANTLQDSFQSSFSQSDKDYLTQVNALFSAAVKRGGGGEAMKQNYLILQQRSSTPSESGNPLTKLSQIPKSLLDQQQVPYSILQYNELIGGIPDFQPVPFSSLPQAEPQLELSSQLQSLVLSPYNTKPSQATFVQRKLALSPSASLREEDRSLVPPDVCVRKTLANFLSQYVDKELIPAFDRAASAGSAGGSSSLEPVKASITSIEGAPPSSQEFTRLFRRLRSFNARPTLISDGKTPGGVEVTEVLSFEFKQVLRLPQFMNWLQDTWYYTALLESKASLIRSGARPVSMRIVDSNTLQLDWVDLNPKDLSVVKVGALQFKFLLNSQNQVNAEDDLPDEEEEEQKVGAKLRSKGRGKKKTAAVPDQLVVYRLKYPRNIELTLSANAPPREELVAETVLLERLIEGINKNVYKKMFVLPMDDEEVEV